MKTEFTFDRSGDYPDAGTITFPEFPGYVAKVSYDQFPEAPDSISDCNPPLARYSESWEGPDARELFDEIPEEIVTREYKRILAAVIACEGDAEGTRMDYAQARREYGNTRAEALREILPDAPGSGLWRAVDEYCELLAELCRIAGFAWHHEISRGYSQGDAAHLFCYASPAWVTESGCPPEHHESACKSYAAEWGAYLWGDVFAVSGIVRPDGTEVDDTHAGGYFGNDHEASGIVEFAREEIAMDIEARKRESARAFDAACRDIATV